MKPSIEYLPGGRFRLHTPDGNISPIVSYATPLIFNGYLALSSYYTESVRTINDTIEFETFDHTLSPTIG